jgi:iron complex outermembrane receptor protein/hemoglobin/transferrin/lactoferrin receptor protein
MNKAKLLEISKNWRSVFSSLIVLTLPLAAEVNEVDRSVEGEVLNERVVQLPEYVVTGTALPMRAFEAASDISVLSGDEKLRLQTASLGESLDYLPSVSSISTGAGVGKPVIRGLSGTRIRMLQDGIGVNYQQFGVRHPPNIDPFLAERVELVRGVSSILYGSDAFGGAVNAISPRIDYAAPDQVRQSGRFTYGYESGNDLHTGGVQFGVAGERWGVVGAFVYRDAGNLEVPDVETWNGSSPSGQPSDIPRFDGELPFTDFEQRNGMVKVGYLFGTTEATLRYERWEHANNYLEPDGTGIGVQLENNLLQADLAGVLSANWDWRASYTWNQNLRYANAPGTPLPVENRNVDLERQSHTVRTEFIRGTVEDRFSGTLGFEGLYEEQESKGLGAFTPGGQVENLALFGLGRMVEDPWTFEFGLRYDYRSQKADRSQTRKPNLPPPGAELENDYNVLTASLGAIYQVNDSLALAGNLNRGFRAPSLFELYANGIHGGVAAIQIGRSDLDEETSLGGDLQARWRSDRLDWTATAYVTSFSDYIFLADSGLPGTPPTFVADQDDALLYGGDLTVTHRTTDWLTLEGAYEWVRGELDRGGDVPLLPADQLRLEAVFHRDSLGWMESPEFRIGIRHARSKDSAGPQEPFSQFDGNPNFGTASTDAYTLLDLGFGFRYRDLRVDLFVKNLADEDYRDFLDTYKGYALSPGRSVGIRTSLDF